MEFVRKLALLAIVPLLVLFLFVLASTTSVVRVMADAGKLKNIIAGSDIYQTVVPGLIDEAERVSDGGEDVDISNQVALEVAEKTFTPEFVQQNTEKVIDSIFYWLEGNTPLPDFEIDLTGIKDEFAVNLAAAVETRLAELPKCQDDALPADFDPLAAQCLPSGIDPATEASKVEQTISEGSGFLDHPVITAETIKADDEVQSIFQDQLKEMPQAYQAAKVGPWVLGAICLLFAAALVMLSSSKAKGLRRVGVILLVVGVLIMLGAYGASRALDKGLDQLSLTNQVLEDKSKILVAKLFEEINKTYWLFGAGYGAIGITAIAGSMVARHGNRDEEVDLEGEGETPEDRIELDEPDHPTEFTSPREKTEPASKPKPKVEPKTDRKTSAKKKPTKIKVQ